MSGCRQGHRMSYALQRKIRHFKLLLDATTGTTNIPWSTQASFPKVLNSRQSGGVLRTFCCQASLSNCFGPCEKAGANDPRLSAANLSGPSWTDGLTKILIFGKRVLGEARLVQSLLAPTLLNLTRTHGTYFIHMYVCMYVRTYVCMYVCVCTYVCMYVCMYVCVCAYVCM